MRNIRFLDLEAQYSRIKEGVDAAVSKVISSASFVGGAEVKNFENEFAKYVSASHCIGVANGTDALEIAIEALGMEKGREIIVPANSFIASSEAVTRSGFVVRFCDVCPSTYNATAKTILDCVNENTAAILLVHLYGQPCDIEQILGVAREHKLMVIEDCAQAHGARFGGQHVGTFGDIGTFSFYPGKNLGAYGDAGAIVCSNEEYAAKSRKIANHGRVKKYLHEFEGRNSRLDALQAAVLAEKLKHLDGWIETRRKVASIYNAALSGLEGLVLPYSIPSVDHAWHLYVIRTKSVDELSNCLNECGVQTGRHYPLALPKQPAYSYLPPMDPTAFALTCDDQLLSLPMGDHLSQEDVEYVAAKVRDFFDTLNLAT